MLQRIQNSSVGVTAMGQWEFLLQQEGDRSWLPLESTTAEILEGRYRIMAHSSYANTAVEIRISHVLADQMPPKRRVLKRHHQTNPEGLIVVMPFIHLRPGVWHLQCLGDDLIDDMLGQGWQYAVQLQVLPQTAPDDLPEDWGDYEEDAMADAVEIAASAQGISTTLDVSNLLTPEPDPNAAVSTVPSGADLEQDLVAADLSRYAFMLDADIEADTVDTLEADALEADAAIVDGAKTVEIRDNLASGRSRLQLHQSAYVLPQGRSFTLSGQVQHPEPVAAGNSVEAEEILPCLTLQIYLRDPQTAELIQQIQHPLTTAWEQNFEIEIELPGNLGTRLILGEALVQSSQDNQQSHIWAVQAFTVTTALDELLDIVADQAGGEDADALSLGPVPLLPTESAASVNVAESTVAESTVAESNHQRPLQLPRQQLDMERTTSLWPASGWMMPPQIYHPASENVEGSAIALPSLSSGSHQPSPGDEDADVDMNANVASEPEPSVTAVEATDATEPVDDVVIDDGAEDIEGSDSLKAAELPIEAAELPLKAAELPLEAAELHGPTHGSTRSVELPQFARSRSPRRYPPDHHAPNQHASATTGAPVSRVIDDDLDAAVIAAEQTEPNLWDHQLEMDSDGEKIADQHSTPSAGSEPLMADTAVEAEDALAATENLPDAAPEAVEQSFQALALQNRFWDRLNAFAAEGHQAAHHVRSAIAASEVVVATEGDPTQGAISGSIPPDVPPDVSSMAHEATASTESQSFIDPGEDSFAHEVVIYEDTPPVPSLDALTVKTQDDRHPAADKGSDGDWIIPPPTVLLPDGDLEAGQSLPIRVVLPESSQRFYIKLWVSDRQTRTLVDEPRWLMSLEPDGQGFVETTLRVTVPMHCLDIQIAAIAIDMVTQRESERVFCNRSVVPVNLPSLSLNEFDV